MTDDLRPSTQELAAKLTIAWLSNPNTRAQPSDVREFLQSMFEAVGALAADPTAQVTTSPAEEEFRPATTPRRSLASPEHIISLIDGKPYKSLRRHLTGHGLTPDGYRQRYGLKGDYPMVAPAYAELRRALAKKIGLGRKPGSEGRGPVAKSAKRRRQPASQTA